MSRKIMLVQRCTLALLWLLLGSRIASAQLLDVKSLNGPYAGADFVRNISRVVVASNGTIFILCSEGCYRSTSNGASWTQISSGPSNFSFGFDSTLYLASGAGVFSSSDFGGHWKNLNSELPTGQFYSVVATPSGAILTTFKTGMFRSTDGGATWDHILPTIVTGGTIYVSVTLRGTLLLRNNNSYYRSIDDGVTWTTTVPLDIENFPISESQILRAGNNGLERSTDDGLSWKLAAPSSPFGKYSFYYVTMDRIGRLFSFVNGRIYMSVDTAYSWVYFGTADVVAMGFGLDNMMYLGTTAHGMMRTLKVVSTVSENTKPTELSLVQVAESGGSVIRFSLPSHTHAMLTIFDTRGSEIYTLADRDFDQGRHDISTPTNIARGQYFCRLRTPTAMKVIGMWIEKIPSR